MKRRLMHSLIASIEWRVIAFIITELFFLTTTGKLWDATILAASLQGILFAAYFVWYFLREEPQHAVGGGG